MTDTQVETRIRVMKETLRNEIEKNVSLIQQETEDWESLSDINADLLRPALDELNHDYPQKGDEA